MRKMMNKEHFQDWLNKILDKIGLNENETKERVLYRLKQSVAKDLSEKQISKKEHIKIILAGSHADGTGFNHANDLDILHENNKVSCQFDEHFIDDGKVYFQIVSQNTSPGYAILKLMNKGSAHSFKTIKDALVEVKGETYISSAVYKTKFNCQENKGWISKITECKPPVGPSNPKCTKQNSQEKAILSSLELESYDTDVVCAFQCNAGSIIDAWRNRERKCGWPNKETTANVAMLPAHVVPVGKKGTDDEDLQWRICFTLGEIHLVQNFSNVQRKIFVLMKLIARHLLKPICNDISSYVIKNVIFWISEEIPTEKLNEMNLIKSLQDALIYLLKSIKKKYLKNYMIPERNLFEGKFEGNGQAYQKLISGVKLCINKPEKTIREMKQSLLELKRASKIDKEEQTILESLTTEQLAEMYMEMSTCQTQEDMLLLNMHYKAIPFLMSYGTKWFSSFNIKKFITYFYEYLRKDERTFKDRWDLGLNCATSAFRQQALSKYNGYHGYGGLFLSYHIFVFLPHCCA